LRRICPGRADLYECARPRPYEQLCNCDLSQRTQPRGGPSENLVTPGDPTDSYLYEKLSTATPQVGQQMPQSGQLDPSLLDLVQQWIAAGALDN